MVDRHPSKSINVSSGWQSTISSRKECNIYIISPKRAQIYKYMYMLYKLCYITYWVESTLSSRKAYLCDFIPWTTFLSSIWVDRVDDYTCVTWWAWGSPYRASFWPVCPRLRSRADDRKSSVAVYRCHRLGNTLSTPLVPICDVR